MYLNEERKTTNIDSEFSNKEKKFNFSKKLIIIISSVVIVAILIIILILINKKEYYLVLNGNTDIIIYKDSEYVEEGYTAYDSKGKKYDSEVTVSGVVNSNTIGEYTIEYNFRDIVKTRKVTVINTDTQKTFLVLKGDSKIYLRVNEKYEEPGYIALDSTDKYIEDKVEVKNEVNTSVAGTYKVIYSLTNSSNVKISKIRYVIVMDSNISLTYDNTNYTNQEGNIEVYVDDNYLDYTLLPDGSKTTEHNFTYKVSENGTYKFILYSKDKITKESSIEVKNIDKVAPTGNCSANVNKETKIIVNATDNIKISGYKYYINSEETEYIASNTYTSNLIATNVIVEVKDTAGNINKITCVLNITKTTDEETKENSSTTSSKSSSSKSSSSSTTSSKSQGTYTGITNAITCHGDRTKYNNQLKKIINTNGKRTRATATAIAKYISMEIDAKIPYFWAGGHWHFSWDGHDNVEEFRGFSTEWGCITEGYKEYNGTKSYPAGFDCTGFIAWVLFNTGFTKDEIGSFSGTNYLTSLGNKKLTTFDFAGSTGKVKAGDIVWRSGHMGFVVKIEGETVTIANAKGMNYGLIVEKYSSKTGKNLDGSGESFTKVSSLDNYYE